MIVRDVLTLEAVVDSIAVVLDTGYKSESEGKIRAIR